MQCIKSWFAFLADFLSSTRHIPCESLVDTPDQFINLFTPGRVTGRSTLSYFFFSQTTDCDHALAG